MRVILSGALPRPEEKTPASRERNPRVSVVICAYTLDRWDQLVLAVGSLGHQRPDHETIIVIDHNDELFARASATWPQHRVVANTGARGLSSGRNTALAIATGDIVAFLDDDAWAEPGWLERLVAGFTGPEVVAVGGSAAPIWPDDPPAALPEELLWIVGCSYRGLPEQAGPIRNVMGCSMAFRRDPLMRIGGFNPDTGRIGKLPIGCEETEACIRLRQTDPAAVARYEPAARVRHHVSADRTVIGYVLSRSWCEGLSKAALARTLGPQSALSSESAYATRVLPAGFWRELRSGSPTGAFAIVLSLAAATAGYARGRLAPVRPGARRDPVVAPVLT